MVEIDLSLINGQNFDNIGNKFSKFWGMNKYTLLPISSWYIYEDERVVGCNLKYEKISCIMSGNMLL